MRRCETLVATRDNLSSTRDKIKTEPKSMKLLYSDPKSNPICEKNLTQIRMGWGRFILGWINPNPLTTICQPS